MFLSLSLSLSLSSCYTLTKYMLRPSSREVRGRNCSGRTLAVLSPRISKDRHHPMPSTCAKERDTTHPVTVRLALLRLVAQEVDVGVARGAFEKGEGTLAIDSKVKPLIVHECPREIPTVTVRIDLPLLAHPRRGCVDRRLRRREVASVALEMLGSPMQCRSVGESILRIFSFCFCHCHCRLCLGFHGACGRTAVTTRTRVRPHCD